LLNASERLVLAKVVSVPTIDTIVATSPSSAATPATSTFAQGYSGTGLHRFKPIIVTRINRCQFLLAIEISDFRVFLID
jgi:hypothetical protein